MRTHRLALLATLAASLLAPAAELPVSSAADIAQAASRAKPGDTLVMTDGEWRDQAIVLNARGSAENPITLRPQTPGKVVLAGQSSLIIDGEHTVVTGLLLQNSTATTDGISLRSHHNRVTQCAVVGGRHKFFVHLFGHSNRVDHCYLADKSNDSPTMQVEVEEHPNGHRIDHNHFGHRPPLGRNGGETLRVGYSHQSMRDSGTTVEYNLFDRCDGELEIISNKSCANVYRCNTFLNSAGTLTLRHGNRCLVEGNFFLAGGKRGSGGIRVIGEGHAIINNYIERTADGGIRITSGIVDSPLNGYFQAKDCLIAYNTIVENRGPCLELDAGINSSRRTLRPERITIANNVMIPGEGGTLFKGKEGDAWTWIGNVASAERAGVRNVDPKLQRAIDGHLRPTSASPLIGAAEGEFPIVTRDIDGQPRGPKPDIGCDQLSDAPIANRPLTGVDLGPSWMKDRPRQ
jgi:poly(beta-D-mannuronate) lyase